MSKDGKPLGPTKYKQLNKECYYLAKRSGYSYETILEMTPVQRKYIKEFIEEEFEANKRDAEKLFSKNKNSSNLKTR